jgi:hypothetical protein
LSLACMRQLGTRRWREITDVGADAVGMRTHARDRLPWLVVEIGDFEGSALAKRRLDRVLKWPSQGC